MQNFPDYSLTHSVDFQLIMFQPASNSTSELGSILSLYFHAYDSLNLNAIHSLPPNSIHLVWRHGANLFLKSLNIKPEIQNLLETCFHFILRPNPETQGAFLLYSSCVSTCKHSSEHVTDAHVYYSILCLFIIHIQPENSQLCTYNSVLNIQISNISITMQSYSLEFLPILTISNPLK